MVVGKEKFVLWLTPERKQFVLDAKKANLNARYTVAHSEARLSADQGVEALETLHRHPSYPCHW